MQLTHTSHYHDQCNNHHDTHFIKAFVDKTKADAYLAACKKHHKNKRYAPAILEGPEFEEYLDFHEDWIQTHPAGKDHVNKDGFTLFEVPLEHECCTARYAH